MVERFWFGFFLTVLKSMHIMFCVHLLFYGYEHYLCTQDDLQLHKACVMICLAKSYRGNCIQPYHLCFLRCYLSAGCLYHCIRTGLMHVVWDSCWFFVGLLLLFWWKKLRKKIDKHTQALLTHSAEKNPPLSCSDWGGKNCDVLLDITFPGSKC